MLIRNFWSPGVHHRSRFWFRVIWSRKGQWWWQWFYSWKNLVDAESESESDTTNTEKSEEKLDTTKEKPNNGTIPSSDASTSKDKCSSSNKMNMVLDGDLKSHQLLIPHFIVINSTHLQKHLMRCSQLIFSKYFGQIILQIR